MIMRTPAHKVLDHFLRRQITGVSHDNEQAPDGSKWQALSPLTLLTKRKNRILYEKVRIFSVNSTRVQKRSALHQTHAADNAASIRPALCALKS